MTCTLNNPLYFDGGTHSAVRVKNNIFSVLLTAPLKAIAMAYNVIVVNVCWKLSVCDHC